MSVTVKPLSAVLDKDTDKLGNADPYVVLVLGQDKKKSSVCKSGGTKPSWTDVITFQSKQTKILVQVWDKDTISKDDMIGSGTFDIKKIFSTPSQPYTQYVNLTNNGKPIGQIQLCVIYEGPAINQGWNTNSQTNPNQQGGQQYNQQGYQQNAHTQNQGQGFTLGGNGGATGWDAQKR